MMVQKMESSEEMLQRVIDELNSGEDAEIMRQINATIRHTTAKHQQKVNELTKINKQLTYDIQQKQKEINLLNQINDYNHELIEANSKIAGFTPSSPIDRSLNVFQNIQLRMDEMENLRMKLINESRVINAAITNSRNTQSVLNQEYSSLQDELNNPEQELGDPQQILENDTQIQKISLFRQLGVKVVTMSDESAPSSSTTPTMESDVVVLNSGDRATTLTIGPELSDKEIADLIWENL
ncbi:uncharacterized protein LODBEIA_P01850 [Lodderomyces beijingensis]|uniref:Kinetochore protein Spc24 n=1 Tax=Lodderomyces beijingensis TaxID=1775926 RepID=A0ABP0ZFL1_9ASCO